MAQIPDFFSINLGHDSIKIVQIKNVNNKARLLNISSMPMATGLLDNDSDQGITMLAKEIEKAAKNANIQTKNYVISVPEVSVFSRLITLPKLEESEISDAINYALKPLVPVPLENVNISFLEIDDGKKEESKESVNWYVVAAPKQLITRYQYVAESANLNLLAVETEALSISRMVYYNYIGEITKDIMILDLGAESTNVILARNGVVIFSQNIGSGASSLTKVIAADFGLDMLQAEKYKTTYGLDFEVGEGKIAKSIEPVMQILISEVTRIISYYNEKIKGKGLETVFITGGGGDLPKLAEFLTERLKINAKVVNPTKNIEIDPLIKTDLSKISLNSYDVCIGLGLKGIL